MVFRCFPKKNSVVFSWYISYALILLIPILISSMTYLEAERVVKGQIERSNRFVLKQVQRDMDGMITGMERLSSKVCFSSSIPDVINSIGQDDATFRYSLYKIQNQLSQYGLTDGMIGNVYIYFKDEDTVIASNTSADSEDFYKYFYDPGGLNYNNWLSLISRKYKGEYVYMPETVREGNVYSRVLYIRSFLLEDQNKIINMVINLGESNLQKETDGFELATGGILLAMDNQNNILKLSGTKMNSHPVSFRYDMLEGKEGLFIGKQGGKSVVVSYVASNMNSWKYICIIPWGVYWKQAEYIRMLIIFSIILCIILGGLVAYIVMKRNYKPLNALVSSLNGKIDVSCGSPDNEFNYLRRVVNEAIEDRRKITYRLQEQNSGLRSVFLGRLLKGYERKGTHLDALMESYGIKFQSEYFAVIVFSIKDMSSFIEMYEHMETDECLKLLRYIISNVVEEVVAQENQGYVFEVDELIACLINFKTENVEGGIEEISREGQTVRDFLTEHYKLEFNIGASNLHETIIGVPQAYSEAVEVIEYNRVTASSSVIHYKDLKKTGESGYYYPLNMEYQLINCFKAGDYDSVKVILEELFTGNFNGKTPSLMVVRCLMFDMTSTMIKAVDVISSIYGNTFLESLDPFENMLKCGNIAQMKEEMLELARKVCEYVRQNNNDHKKYNLRDKIVDYVFKNYNDPNLNNTTVAEYLDMNPNYVSSTFKLQYGEGLADFINIVRVNKAKELMKGTGNNINDIASAVGFYNARTFTRCFKKYEGMTPGKFRVSP